jgi:hypothetical protein
MLTRILFIGAVWMVAVAAAPFPGSGVFAYSDFCRYKGVPTGHRVRFTRNGGKSEISITYSGEIIEHVGSTPQSGTVKATKINFNPNTSALSYTYRIGRQQYRFEGHATPEKLAGMLYDTGIPIEMARDNPKRDLEECDLQYVILLKRK